MLVGGQLGFVLFYGGTDYLKSPLEIFAVWHGGFLGVAAALLRFAHRYRIDMLAIIDILVIPVAIGLALGRVGNFINGELYGTVTTLPWGMKFAGADGLRHPTQLYPIAACCFLHLKKRPPAEAAARPCCFS